MDVPASGRRAPPAVPRIEEARVMRTRAFPVAAAVVLCALAAPASAQIIATSIPKEFTGSGKAGTAEKKWAFHIMGTPVAKWKINQFEETDTSFVSTSANPNSKFLGAAEVAFKAGSDMTVGVGGWFNKVGSTDYDFTFIDVSDGSLGLSGIQTNDLTVSEGHVNVFYKDFGVQVGVVHGSSTVTNLSIGNFLLDDNVFTRAGLVNLFNSVGQNGEAVVRGIENDARGEEITTNDVDAYLVYKAGSRISESFGWSASLGGGIYRYGGADKTVPSGFATLSLDLYKGLGIDASFWYIGKSNSELQEALDVTDNLSRFSIGIGYTFSR
jgi:hypothetical protein